MNRESCDSDVTCPITPILDLISAKWTVQILRELALGPVRTRRFIKLIPGLSMKSLQERLKALLAFGMITREKFEEKLPHVEHTITPRGRRLFAVLIELREIAAELTAVNCTCPMQEGCQTEFDCPSRREPLTTVKLLTKGGEG